MLRFGEGSHRFLCLLSIWMVFFCISLSSGAEVKIRYVSSTECDRYSLDAVYNDKFKPITSNIFKDVIAFANKVSDSVTESLISTMATLPNREASDSSEKRVHEQFKTVKSAFRTRVNKEHKNITAKWDDLISCSFDLLYDNGKTNLKEYLNKALNVTEAYKEARNSLDTTLAAFVGFIKSIVADGLQGISRSAAQALQKEAEAKKKNATETEESKEETPQEEETQETEEEKMKKKKLEITEMIVSGFLGNVTVEVIKQNIDLFKKITLKPEDRDSVLDDMLFDLLMIKNRMLSIIHEDIPNEKGSIDLARRSISMYWSEQAEIMYKEKLKSKESTSPSSEAYYEKLWSDDKTLMNTFLNLMEVYE